MFCVFLKFVLIFCGIQKQNINLDMIHVETNAHATQNINTNCIELTKLRNK